MELPEGFKFLQRVMEHREMEEYSLFCHKVEELMAHSWSMAQALKKIKDVPFKHYICVKDGSDLKVHFVGQDVCKQWAHEALEGFERWS